MEILKNELRIGNWVETYMVMLSGSWFDKEGNRHGQDVLTEPTMRQKQIDIEDLKIISESKGLPATYRGIPLTPELLEKCGFKKEGPSSYIHKFDKNWGMRLFYLDNTVKWCANEFFVVEIKYLHQLQNLYFSLVNQELNIQL